MHSKAKERMPVSDVWKMSRNRPREQNLNALRTSAEVKAGSARFFSHEELREIARVSKTFMFCGLWRK